MDWRRVSHILFTWICTLKHEVLTAVLEMHGESHSELKFSSGGFFFLAAFPQRSHNPAFRRSVLERTAVCFPSEHIHAFTATSSAATRCRAGQQLLSTTDELKMSSRRFATGGANLSVAPAGFPLCFVSTLLLDGAHYSRPALAVPRLQH